MRPGISIILSPADRRRLEALVGDRNVAQKHVWRARIVLHSADGIGTNGIMRRTGKSKTCVWRWQERFAQEGYDGLLRDKTRPPHIPPLGPEVAERVVALTLSDPPAEATHWVAAMMAKSFFDGALFSFGRDLPEMRTHGSYTHEPKASNRGATREASYKAPVGGRCLTGDSPQ